MAIILFVGIFLYYYFKDIKYFSLKNVRCCGINNCIIVFLNKYDVFYKLCEIKEMRSNNGVIMTNEESTKSKKYEKNNTLVSFNDWAELATKKKNDVVNDIFLKYSEYAYDEFWEEKIKNIAYGKLPPKFKLSDNKIYYGKIKETSPNLQLDDDYNRTCINIIDFFKSFGGIFSPNDEIIVEEVEPENNVYEPPLTWSTAKKAVKECLVSEYISRMSKDMFLSYKQKEQLREIVNCGILSKIFGKDNIIIENNIIYEIKGLYWDEKEKNFYIDQKYEKIIQTGDDIRYLVKEDIVTDDLSKRDNTPQFTTKFKKYLQYLEEKL